MDSLPVSLLSMAPRVSQAQALEALGRHSIWHGRQPLQRMALAYVPFRLFEVHVVNHGNNEKRLFAGDAVSGALDPYQFDAPPDLTQVESRNAPPVVLALPPARELMEGKVRRMIFQTGFFRVRGLSVRVEREVAQFHVPYWLAFYGEQQIRLRVMDAVRRTMEGGKARALFEDWLSGRFDAAPTALHNGAAAMPKSPL